MNEILNLDLETKKNRAKFRITITWTDFILYLRESGFFFISLSCVDVILDQPDALLWIARNPVRRGAMWTLELDARLVCVLHIEVSITAIVFFSDFVFKIRLIRLGFSFQKQKNTVFVTIY